MTLKDYRKWTAVLAFGVMAFVLELLGKLTGNFVTVATIGIGAFTAANAFEHHTKNKAGEA